MKAWNGGSIESAMKFAKERRDEMIKQGATLCEECNGEGGLMASGICQQCHGSGCIIPSGGLKLPAHYSDNLCLICHQQMPDDGWHRIDRGGDEGDEFFCSERCYEETQPHNDPSERTGDPS